MTREPAALHLMLSPRHLDVVDEYLADLTDALADVRAGRRSEAREARYN